MVADADNEKGQRQRPSVTIDLTAAQVRPGPASGAEAAKPEPSRNADDAKPAGLAGAGRRTSDRSGATQYFRGAAQALSGGEGFRNNLLIGAVGGVVALIVVLVLQSVTILPVPGRSAANQAIEQAKTASDATAALDRRLNAVETMTEAISGVRADIKTLTDRVAELEASRGTTASRGDVDALASNVAALGKHLDGMPPAVTRDDLAAATDRLGRLEAAVASGGSGEGASSAAVASLTSQLADAQTQIRTLADRLTTAEAKTAVAIPVAGGESAVRAVAMVSLRRAAESGQPFSADLDLVSNLGIGGGDVAALRPLAAKGVASRASIVAEFPIVADAILSAATASDPNTGLVRRVLDGLGGLITVRPIGPVAGSDPAAVVSRMSDAVGRGDLSAALAERDGLPQAGKDASAAWAVKATDRTALDAAVGRIAGALDAAKAG
jgi:hypothetical protein